MSTKRVILILVLVAVGGAGYMVTNRLLETKKLRTADKALFLTGDYEKAVENYTDLIGEHPDKAGLYYKRGDAYVHLEEFTKAIADYKNALLHGISDTLQTNLRIGTSQMELRDWSSAKTTFQALLRLCSSTDTLELWSAHYHLGQIEYKLREYREAISNYDSALTFGSSTLPLYHRANAYHALGMLDSAVTDYNKSIAFAKHDFVRQYPSSSIARCDTCGFPFGSSEYDLLTRAPNRTVLEAIQQAEGGEELEELKRKLENAANEN